jgi:hypothetical protein
VVFGAEYDAEARVFWSAAGIVIEDDGLVPPDPNFVEACASDGDCGPSLHMTPVGYPNASTIRYELDADRDLSVSINEPWFVGWHARLSVQRVDGLETVGDRAGKLAVILLSFSGRQDDGIVSVLVQQLAEERVGPGPAIV